MTTQQDKAALLHDLHRRGEPLVLANVWDALGARLVAAAGAPAIATASASASWSLGVPDHEGLDLADAVALIGRVARTVDLPVTADIESGYGTTAAEVGATVAAVLAAGAVGVNLEDGTRDAAEHAERIAAARAAADAAGVPLYVNARTDGFLLGLGEPEGRLEEAVRRAEEYLAAGASGIFVPGVRDPGTIAALAAAIPAPLNVLAGPGAPSVAELAALGVARISLGPAPALAAYGVLRDGAAELYRTGRYDGLATPFGYADANGLMQ
ncbi:isocitrate lyase/phosphoenolpyruvate mutase family protein [Kitasatospora paranensis]|uniref:Isocitrate lyase/phosphoenolpyruvate mutase family protein n=1 Tax=Kitasatospora paranensis TaxID=258053 RepID=A0ABW2FR15_9ACTN